MKQCFSLHNMCELYHICCFIRQSHGVEKWAIYHHGEYISGSEADASTQRLPGQVRRERDSGKRHVWSAILLAKWSVIFTPVIKICWLRLIINKSNDKAEGNNYHEISCSSCSFFMRPEFWFNQRSAVVLSKTTLLYWIIIFLNWNGTNTFSLAYGKILSS